MLSDDACYQKFRVLDKRTGENMNTCKGDSGGPLIVQADNGLDNGLISYGRGCGDGGVVTRVSNYYN